MNVRTVAFAVLLPLLGTAADATEVYRTTLPDGTVIYADRPQGENSQLVLSVAPRAAHTAAPAAGAPPAPSATAQARPQAAAPPAPLPPGPTAAQLLAMRQKNCEIARERQERYRISRRLFTTNEAGEREYLDDAAVAQAHEQAAADVKDWCN